MKCLYRKNLFKLFNVLFFATVINGQESCTTPALENGFCVPYKDCPFVQELTQNYGSAEAIPKYYFNFIFKSKCSKDNEPIRLCCKLPKDYVKPTAQPTETPTQTTPAGADPRLTEDLDYNKDFNSQFNAQGLSILSGSSCGTTGGDRVAGGNETDLAEYPWMALIRYDAPGDEFKCGGSLISNRYVLTATHCVNKGIYPAIGVRLGEHDLSTNPDCRQKGRKKVCSPVVEDFGIEKIITHPRYNERRRINDIALIKLDRKVDFKKHIKPVCLPITKPSYEIESNAFTIAGWGATEKSTRSLVLLKAQVLGQSRSVCQNVFSSFSIEINLKHICAGDLKTGRDTCRGDSGGPLVGFNTYSDVKRFIQYGVVASGGIACNLEQGFPGIYTNVLTYLPWITNNIVD
ncbi:serine protease grass-like [Lucilia sericata]|uniref:serine protease grass-like n=1 Tax=Lucilia sericata TaxID=13632 RepID=UPI0018A801B9|nr:serine protease grass-like [Lucilia sericata]